MTNVSFFIYLFASCIGVAIAALLLLAFRIRQERAPWRNILVLFVLDMFLLCLLYFGERFYTDNFVTQGGWSVAERCLDLLLGTGQILLWCHYLRQKASASRHRLGKASDLALIGIFLMQIILYTVFLDEHYFIAAAGPRRLATGLYILFMAMWTAILAGHSILLHRRFDEVRPRRYLDAITGLLLADILWEGFYCIMLFGGSPLLDRGLYQSFDLVSILFFLTMLTTALYIYRCENEQLLPKTAEQLAEEERSVQEAALQQAGLSQRELEVAMLLLQANSYEQIAEALFISKHTVKRHVHNIYQKLGVAGRAEMEDRLKD